MTDVVRTDEDVDPQRTRRVAEEKRRGLAAEMAEIHERAGSDPLSAGDQQRWDNLERGIKKLDVTIAQATAAATDELRRGVEEGRYTLEPGDSGIPIDRTPRRRAVAGVRGEALRAVDGDRHTNDDARQAITVALETVEDPRDEIARWAIAASNPAYRSAYTSLMVDPDRAHLGWSADEREAFTEAQAVARSMSIGTNGSGGYLVPTSLDPNWIITNDGTINPIRELARKVTAITSSWTGIATGGVSAEWKSEGSEAADAAPTDLTAPNIPVHLADVFVPFSFELEQDQAALGHELALAMADAKTVHENTAFTVGTGSGQPTGLVTAVKAVGGSVVDPANAETFAVGDVYKVAGALPARHQANAAWLANPSTEYLVRQFATGAGPSHAFWADLAAGSPPQLLGKPWHTASEMDGTWDVGATADNYILAFGDFNKYVIADRVGVVTELVPHLFGANGRPTGQRGILMHWRVGADVVDANAFRLLNLATTA